MHLPHDPNDASVEPPPQLVTDKAHDRVTGVDIRIDRVGQGPPLVILNGLLGLNEHWFPCLRHLADDVECVLLQPPLLEMRGKGCTVDGVMQLTLSVLETLLDEPAILAGNSLGGHIALRLAHAKPEIAKGLVLIGSSGLFERTFEKNVQHTPSREWIDNKIRELFFNPDRMLPGMVDKAYAELSRRSAARALVKLGRSAKSDHLGEILPELRMPTQLIWGQHDIVTPPVVARQFADLLPDARLAWIDDCGHAPQIESPDDVARVILGFVRELHSAGVEGRQGVA
jgi:2-hydroxy-6-oxonona-2,4-dienedioate hydrolase